MVNQSKRRPYRLRQRAASMEETRRRIAKATFELHAAVGPAYTTIADIADRAGVERATVYRHFPDELSLYRGCIGHGSAAHPFPATSPWRAIADPEQRLRTALAELYAYYRENESLMFNVFRDIPAMPVFAQATAESGMFDYFDGVGSVLAEGWPVRRGSRRGTLLRAAVGHAIEFQTWHSLARRQGLSDPQAVEVMTSMACCVAVA
jgi:AcrR family transcriptional regulator